MQTQFQKNKDNIQQKKFQKKYEFLESSLSTFLYWRTISSKQTLVTQMFIRNWKTTLEEENICLKNNSSELKHKKQNNNFYGSELNLFNYFNQHFSPKNLFPDTIPYLQYWLIPLVGLVILNFKEDQFYYLMKNNKIINLNSSQSTNYNNNNKVDTNILSNISIENKLITEQFSNVCKLEKEELTQLCDYYSNKLTKNIEYKSNHIKNLNIATKNKQLMDINSSIELFRTLKYKSANFYWTWFRLKNNNYQTQQTYNQTTQFLKNNNQKSLLNNWSLFFHEIPKQMEPLPEHCLNPNFKMSFNSFKNSSSKNEIYLQNFNFTNPVQSFKVAEIFLDEFIKTTISNPIQIILDPLEYSKIVHNFDLEKSKLLKMIDKLCKQTIIEESYIFDKKVNLKLETKNSHEIKNKNLYKSNIFVNTMKQKMIKLKVKNQIKSNYFKLQQCNDPMKKQNKFLDTKDSNHFLIQFKERKKISLNKINFIYKTLNHKYSKKIISNFYLNQFFKVLNNIYTNENSISKKTQNAKLTNKNKKVFSEKSIQLLTSKVFLLKNLKMLLTQIHHINNIQIKFKNRYSITSQSEFNQRQKKKRTLLANVIFKKKLLSQILLEPLLEKSIENQNLIFKKLTKSGTKYSKKGITNIVKLHNPILISNYNLIDKAFMSKYLEHTKNNKLSNLTSLLYFHKQANSPNNQPLVSQSVLNLEKNNDLFELYSLKFNDFLKYFNFKIQTLSTNNQLKLIKNHKHTSAITFSPKQNINNQLKDPILIKQNQNSIFAKSNIVQSSSKLYKTKLKFKIIKKANMFNKILLNKNFAKRKIEKILRTYLSSKITSKKTLYYKKQNNKFKLFNIKKQQLKVLKNLKIRLKTSELSWKNYTKTKLLFTSKILETKHQISTTNKKERKKQETKTLRKIVKKQNLTDLTNQQTNLQKNNPKNLLKRIGFIFLNEFDKNKIYLSQKENENMSNSQFKNLKRIQKQKYQQKKQRRKKQNLETRRRKKRKRFYPRPNWLRFQLYQNFLQNRHLKELRNLNFSDISAINLQSKEIAHQRFIQKTGLADISASGLVLKKLANSNIIPQLVAHENQDNSISKTQLSSINSIYSLNRQNINSNSVKKAIYRQNKQKWNLNNEIKPYSEKLIFQKLPLLESMPILSNQDFYKISNTIMTDFQRLCWKSYWLRSNLNPYIERIQNNLNQIKESQKTFYSELTLKIFFTSLFGLNNLENSNTILNQFLLKHDSLNDLNFYKNEKQVSPSLDWYLNYKSSFNENNQSHFFSIFFNQQNMNGYDYVSVNRIANIIKNVRTNLNANGQTQAHSFIQGRTKLDKVNLKTDWNEFFYNCSRGIGYFSPLNFSGNTFFIPTSQLTNLRILWSLNQTNLLTFKQHNDVNQLWQYLKIREQNKSNKTKKFLIKSFNSIFPKNLESVCFEKTARIQKKLNWQKSNTKSYLKLTATNDANLFITKTLYALPIFDYTDQKQLPNQNSSNIFKIPNSIREEVTQFNVKNTDLISHNFRAFKFQLKSNGLIKISQNSNFKIKNSLAYNFQSKEMNNVSFKKSAKDSVHFWWSTKNLFDSFIPMSSTVLESDFKSTQELSVLNSLILFTTLWFCAMFFHLSILFSILRISEIRSLMKVYFLILSKLSESYFLLLNIINNLVVNSKNQMARTISTISNKIVFLKRSKPMYQSFSKIKINPNNNLSSLDKTQFFEKFALERLVLLENKIAINNQSTNTINSILSLKQLNKKLLTSSKYTEHNLVEKLILRLPKISITNLYNSFPFVTEFSPNNKSFQNSFNSKIVSTKNDLIVDLKEQKQNAIEFESLENQQKKHLIQYKNQLNKTLQLSETNSSKLFLEQIRSFLVLPIFLITKYSLIIFDSTLSILYQILFKIIDILESIVMIIYKFLEKPAELLIEWIGQIFLIEWTSDMICFLPDLLDTNIWNSFYKFSRASRITPLFGFLIQRRLWSFMELFVDHLSRPDIDLLERQKKGIIFWDIWAEVLIQAAENYQMNVSSFMTLKEEQDLFMEKLLEDSNWEWAQSSMLTMSPLLSFLEKEGSNHLNFSFLIEKNATKFHSQKLIDNTLLNSVSQKNSNNFNFPFGKKSQTSISNIFSNFPNLNIQTYSKWARINQFENSTISKNWKRWSANQSFTYQGRDTDLFVDLHPPKSFHHLSFLRSNEIAQQTLGPLVCQIYTGIFSNEVAKNILLVGSPGTAKTLFIQALAGETELKIMTDHAQRYAVIQRGVAVGMKLLRDVFDAISLHTPCIFLIEEIHLIGERRPMLISDQESAFSNENLFGVDQEEVHEKNQLLYQWSRHTISHYQRPYKSDFSLIIPTNHFCFDLFLGRSTPQTRQTLLTPKSPLPIANIEMQLNSENMNSFGNLLFSTKEPFKSNKHTNLVSNLQLSKEKFFTPPATSPFLVFALKEQQKVKPRKRVKQIPWGGLSFDQMNLLPKVSYSIRIKVALLADVAIRNLSVKLDMITDLLVILDNVRSNRGFVVFATTHIPSALDPALRRPGRFDETISLPILPNLVNRWEILKTNLTEFSSTFDFLDSAIITSTLTENVLLQLIMQTKLSLFNTLIPNDSSFEYFGNVTKKEDGYLDFSQYQFSDMDFKKQNFKNQNLIKAEISMLNRNNKFSKSLSKFPIYNLNAAFKLTTQKSILKPEQIQQKFQKIQHKKQYKQKFASFFNKTNLLKKFGFYPSLTPNSSMLLSITYFKIGTFFISTKFLSDQTSYHRIAWTKMNQFENPEEFIFKQLYSPRYELKNELIRFFSGKITEFLVLTPYMHQKYQALTYQHTAQQNSRNSYELNLFNNLKKKEKQTEKIFKPFPFNQQFTTIDGFNLFWKSATSFVSSLLQKRFLYQQNLVTTQFLSFENFSLLNKPANPPASSILMPAKKYENFQRTHRDFQQKNLLSINEKLQLHQQQRLIKTLYKKPIQNTFYSELISDHLTPFSSSFQELGYLDSLMLKSTAVNAYYKNCVLTRHKFSLIHQWWTGHLPEHNIETTFLSDVDWRSMFVKSIGDVVIDFPDAEQYYNPRKRRWFLNSTSWSYWLSFEKILSNEISYHFMIQCFNNASQYLENHREILDYYAHSFLKNAVLREIDLITIQSRFYAE